MHESTCNRKDEFFIQKKKLFGTSHAADEFRNPTKGVAQLNSAKRAFFFNGRLYDVLPRSRTLVIDVRQLHNEKNLEKLKGKDNMFKQFQEKVIKKRKVSRVRD
ncbi:hypothetical protein NPIL_84181 [Nephila pilipes]|uniref:Uncharacterized protein n=1 Tax=Nephila pilipes TaxID=299642 RepID=A0A8X6Q8Q9_NEPPI|nr:hypothetical protein NPIL_84181 [Nephila pilipes]